MKTKILTALFGAMLTCYTVNSNAQPFTGTGAGTNIIGGLNYGSTSHGDYSMHFTTNGSYNTAMGQYSLYKNVSGMFNTATGSYSLYNNTASNNTAHGYFSLYKNTIGQYNTSMGNSSMYYNISGDENVAIGRRSLYKNTTGKQNSAIGTNALYSNQTGSYNTAGGYNSLYNSTGDANTAYGHYALYFNTGNYNTACGNNSMLNNTTGKYNTAVGIQSLSINQTGTDNTAMGASALNANIIGSFNTAIGSGADVAFGGLNHATAIGANAVAQANNSTAIGANAVVVAPNTIWMGDAALAGTFCVAGMYVVSDGRFKKNMQENVPGLQFIKALKPLTYNYDMHSFNKYKGVKENSGELAESDKEKSIANKEKTLYTGFIAQEVEKAAKELGYDFSGVYKPQNDKDVYGLSYADFVVPLVKSVQELSKMNDDLQKQNDDLNARIAKLESVVFAQAASSSSAQSSKAISVTNASLEQNIPNPLTNSTSIRYNIPAAFKTAQMIIADFSGKIIKQVVLNTAGSGILNVDASLLSNGAYSYSLMVDGRIIASKKMVVTK